MADAEVQVRQAITTSSANSTIDERRDENQAQADQSWSRRWRDCKSSEWSSAFVQRIVPTQCQVFPLPRRRPQLLVVHDPHIAITIERKRSIALMTAVVMTAHRDDAES